MKRFRKALVTLLFLVFGFFFALFGVVKVNPLEALENEIKESIVLGNLESPIEVYIFSDWQCPACRNLEPTLEKIIPEIEKKARIIFVDTIVHVESLNFIPYNLSFLTHQKDKYIELRKILTKISESNSDPAEEEIEQAILPLNVKYQQLSYSDVAAGIKYFKHLVKQFDIEATPTVVIIHTGEKKGKKLMGSEITEDNIMKAINSMANITDVKD